MKIEDIKITEDRIEVIYRIPSNEMYACMPPVPVPDKALKKVYGVQGGKIMLLEEREGRVEPPVTTPERISF